MNRRISGAMALVVALTGLAAADVRAQRTSPASNSTQAFWQAERAFYLTKTLERAQRQLKDTYLKVEIGTMAPLDVNVAEQAVAQIDAAIKADTVRDPSGAPPQGAAAARLKLAQALNDLDLTEVKFNNGMVTTKDMFAAYSGVVDILIRR